MRYGRRGKSNEKIACAGLRNDCYVCALWDASVTTTKGQLGGGRPRGYESGSFSRTAKYGRFVVRDGTRHTGEKLIGVRDVNDKASDGAE